MDSNGASTLPFDSFKSKKVLRSSVNKPHSSDEPLVQSPISSKNPATPKHPPPRRLTRRPALLSVNQVREAAKKLRKSDLKPSVSSDPVTSVPGPTDTLITKPNISKPLPEKYEILIKFFNSLESSIRLLGLKGSMTTFTNISRTVESLTDRRFAYSHLAQLKFILGEGIEIKRILVRDDRTCCMKPDLQVTLNFRVVQNDEKQKSDDRNLQMRKLFRSRLLKFCESNPKGSEVPKEELPEPFNELSVTSSNAMRESVKETTHAIPEAHSVVASHMPPSFKRRFSKQVLSHNVERVDQESAVFTTRAQDLPVSNQVSDRPTKLVPNQASDRPSTKVVSNQVSDHASMEVACVSNAPSPVKWSSKLPETPIKKFDLEKKNDLSSTIGSPVGHISTPFSATPAQASRPQVRGFMTPDEDLMMSPSKLTRRSSGRRSITFDTPVKNKAPYVQRKSTSDNDDLSDVLSEDLLASIKEKEQKAVEENDPAISQAKWRKQMIAGLPRLFDILLFFFQSIKRSVITKEELMHRIISSHLEIFDRREADEQIKLLLELAPEWIYEKTASTGDLLFWISLPIAEIVNPCGSLRMRQRVLLEFRIPKRPSFGTNHWGGVSPLLAREIPKESLKQRYRRFNNIQTHDEISPVHEDELRYLRQSRAQTPKRSRKGILLKLIWPDKKKKIHVILRAKMKWFPKLERKGRWPQGW